jgi:agmatinase
MNKDNFLGLDGDFTDFEKSKFVVLPISYDKTASFLKGTAQAPKRIIEVSEQLELFDEQLAEEFYLCGIHTHKQIGSNNLTPEELFDEVYRTAKKLYSQNKTILGLGGEHSVSIGLIKCANENHKNMSVLQIDAHADLRDEYEDSKLSHACVMKRVFDMGIPAIGVGIRSFDKAQYEFMLQNNLDIYTPWRISASPKWIDEIVSKLSDNVYITLDIDGLDCSVVPGTGTPEPGGLSYQQVVDLIIKIGRTKKIVGADIVEVMPIAASHTSEFIAARLAYKLIAAMQL